MNIIIFCNQTDCICSQKPEKPALGEDMWLCTHFNPAIKTTFKVDVGNKIRTCHSKDKRAV